MAGANGNEEGSEPAQKDEQTTFDSYRGTAAAIVATGLVRLDQLPGQPGRDPLRMFYRQGEPAEAVRRLDSQPDPENWIRVDRQKADLYSLTVGLSREDSLLRRAAKRTRYARLDAGYLAADRQRENAEKEKRRSDAETSAHNFTLRLAAVESLCRYAQAAVQLKMGDSAKLERADDDLRAAIAALVDIRAEIEATDPCGPDQYAAEIANRGIRATSEYLRCSRRD